MAIIKCKMCGGDLVIEQGNSVAECEYCGTMQTVPNVDDEKKVTLFARANRLRANNEFDKASGIYESIVADFPEEAEAYWGLVLCKYGIEYVDDPATAKKIPTCHRSSFDSVMDDNNFDLTLEYADVVARKVYREEAKVIEDIRKGIIEVSSKEEPYDIFICYKETDENGSRTIDSVLAQDIYDVLTEKGYRTFFAKITLEDKLGQEYEPYIFAALNSAKIMLAVGTDYEYYNAVWVKNEWSRFLKLMTADKSKHLIPCYKNIDAYDMPKEFARLQAQDLGKVGAMQDLLRGIEKILPKQTSEVVKETVIKETVVSSASANSPNVNSLLERTFMFLEDGDFKSADEYCEKVLDINPKCAEAYLGKMLCVLKLKKEEQLGDLEESFENTKFFDKVMRFADDELKNRLNGYLDKINNRIKEENKRNELERRRKEELRRLKSEQEARELADKISLLTEKREKLSIAKKALIQTPNSNFPMHFGLSLNGRVFISCEDKYKSKAANWTDVVELSAGEFHVVGLKSDGTVCSTGDNRYGQCNVSYWNNIVQISSGGWHSVGLKSDGTVVATGCSDDGRTNVSSWTDIVKISAGKCHTVGLKRNGTVVATGLNNGGRCNVFNWRDIVEIWAFNGVTVGLKKDGTVSVVGDSIENCDVSGWTDIVDISIGYTYMMGLKNNGTVLLTGETYGGMNVSGWRDIVSISAKNIHAVGLRADGTAVATGVNEDGQCNVSAWRDIVAISAGNFCTLGLKENGTIVNVGVENAQPYNYISRWKLFNNYNNILIEQRDAQKAMNLRQQGVCQHCGGAFKGLFTKKCSNCGIEKDY